jgi:lipopolysaccharide transport system permease protein
MPQATVSHITSTTSEDGWVIIQPSSGWTELHLRELWAHRELVTFLVWREIKVRYKQTAFGAGWALIQPLFTMLIFSLFFGRLGKIPSDNIPYPMFCLSGLVPWTFLSNGLTQSSNSLVGSANLITKIYFPRLAIPLAAVISGLLDFAIAFLLLVGMMVYRGIMPSVNVFWLPMFILMTIAATLGVGLWLSALNVEYRDIRYVVPFLAQIWMYATPIAYPSSLLHEPWRTIYALNPMVGVVEGFRWSLFGVGSAPGPMFAVSAFATLAVLVSGAYYFRRMERTFADLI